MPLDKILIYLMGIIPEEEGAERCTWKNFVENGPSRIDPEDTRCYYCNGCDTDCRSYTPLFGIDRRRLDNYGRKK